MWDEDLLHEPLFYSRQSAVNKNSDVPVMGSLDDDDPKDRFEKGHNRGRSLSATVSASGVGAAPAAEDRPQVAVTSSVSKMPPTTPQRGAQQGMPKSTSKPHVSEIEEEAAVPDGNATSLLGQIILPTNKFTAREGAVRFRQDLELVPWTRQLHIEVHYQWDEAHYYHFSSNYHGQLFFFFFFFFFLVSSF